MKQNAEQIANFLLDMQDLVSSHIAGCLGMPNMLEGCTFKPEAQKLLDMCDKAPLSSSSTRRRTKDHS